MPVQQRPAGRPTSSTTATTIWLIDYEYSGNNDACFELGNIGAECGLSDDALAELVDRVLRAAAAEQDRPGRCCSGLVGKYGWTLWGAIQAAASPIDFDFWSWAMERYEGAAAAIHQPGFARLLDDVRARTEEPDASRRPGDRS